jgi:hypothetical protein
LDNTAMYTSNITCQRQSQTKSAGIRFKEDPGKAPCNNRTTTVNTVERGNAVYFSYKHEN